MPTLAETLADIEGRVGILETKVQRLIERTVDRDDMPPVIRDEVDVQLRQAARLAAREQVRKTPIR